MLLILCNVILYLWQFCGKRSYDCRVGIKVGGKVIDVMSYADVKAVIASLQKGLHEVMNRLSADTKEYGMKINV